MKFHGKSIIIISIMILGLLIILLLNGCFLFRQYGNIEGYVYVPESPTKGMPIILRDSSQVPAGYKPLVGATVGAVGFSVITTTDNDGYFILIDLPTGMIIVNIIPPSGSGYQSLTIPIQVVGNTTVDIGNYGSVSLPSENTDHWDVTINKIDTTNWPEVKVYVQVIDPVNNSPIIGATSNDFEVDISGNKIGSLTVTQFGGTSASPSSSSLVIDRSGSMSGTKLSDAKDAAKTFVGFMTANDRAEVVSFASSVTVDQSFTNDKSALYNAIDNLYAVGWTALYDGIWQGLDDTNLETNERKAVIVLTDGQENWSSSEHGGGSPPDNSDVIGHAKKLNIPVYTIGLGLSKGFTVEEGVRISRDFDPAEDLEQIADDTGGKPFNAPTSTDLEYIYVQITQRIQQQYIITFTDNTGITSGILTVKVNYNQISGEASKDYKPYKPYGPLIPRYLLNLIDTHTASYYNRGWELTEDQYKAWIATIAWAEGKMGGFTAHSRWAPGSDVFYHKSLGDRFYFSTGIGPFQLDFHGRDWPTIDKLNPERALSDVLQTHKNNYGPGSFLQNFSNNSDWKKGVLPGKVESAWLEVTGSEWKDNNNGKNPSLNWEEIKEQLANDDPTYSYESNVCALGYRKWNIKASNVDIDTNNPIFTDTNKPVIFDGDYPTWWIIARDETGSEKFRYYYTYDPNTKIEVWAYADDSTYKYIFVREYSTGQYPEGYPKLYCGFTLSDSALTP